MRLPTPFVKLPFRFDAEKMAAEVSQFPESEWRVHPKDYEGNSALILISHGGTDNNDSFGMMAATPRLKTCPYLMQVFASFETVLGRSRLMRLAPGAEVKPHSDTAYYWHDHIRIHVPIVTDPGVRFVCDGTEVHMEAGEAWIFDNWRPHYVLNHTKTTRIHLVIDTVGSAAFWHLVSRGTLVPPRTFEQKTGTQPKLIQHEPKHRFSLAIEQHNLDAVAHPDTVRSIVQEWISDLRQIGTTDPKLGGLELLLADFSHNWRSIASMYANISDGYAEYQTLIQQTIQHISRAFPEVRLPSNSLPLEQIVRSYLPALLQPRDTTTPALMVPGFDRPVIILSAPRSGSSLLYETLQRCAEIWALGDESHGEIENLPGLSPADRGYVSNALDTTDATTEVIEALRRMFAQRIRGPHGELYANLAPADRPGTIRFLEKTPKNALRIPFLNAVFPDAYFIFLYRDPGPNLASMIEAWQSGKFITYASLPDWQGLPWSLLLIPDWRNLPAKDLTTVVANQWRSANTAILEGLNRLPAGRWCTLAYEQFLAAPAETIGKLCRFSGLRQIRELDKSQALPLSRYTLTLPSTEKWLRHAAEIQRVMHLVEPVYSRIQALENRL